MHILSWIFSTEGLWMHVGNWTFKKSTEIPWGVKINHEATCVIINGYNYNYFLEVTMACIFSCGSALYEAIQLQTFIGSAL